MDVIRGCESLRKEFGPAFIYCNFIIIYSNREGIVTEESAWLFVYSEYLECDGLNYEEFPFTRMSDSAQTSAPGSQSLRCAHKQNSKPRRKRRKSVLSKRGDLLVFAMGGVNSYITWRKAALIFREYGFTFRIIALLVGNRPLGKPVGDTLI